MAASTLTAAFQDTVKKHGTNISLISKARGVYKGFDYTELNNRVRNLALGLAALGIKKGDKVSILSENRAEWAISDLAILSLGAINVPIYPTLTPKQIEYILNDADVKIIISSTIEQSTKIAKIFNKLPSLSHLISMNQLVDTKDFMLFINDVYEKGSNFHTDNPEYFSKVAAAIEPDDPCAIVYTSGTTGKPKGAILSHYNILSNVYGAVETLNIRSTDKFLSFLPLCHVFERMGGQFCPLCVGGSIAYAESIETVAQNLVEVKPTIMCSVPRLFEKIHGKILQNANSESPIKKNIFYWALNTGYKYRAAEKTGKISGGLKFRYNLANKLVFKKIQAKVGGRLRYFISGGAPLAKEIGEFFHAVGVTILEGYGLTETSPVIAVNAEGKMKFGTVGPALSTGGVEIKIGKDKEILTRGPHIMQGYYKNPTATKEIIDKEGWLHTGDIGFLDPDGYLTITDRKKNILVSSGGRNVAPAPIENALLGSPLIEQVIIIGDKRKFLSALIFPNQELLENHARKHNISFNNFEQLCNNENINQLIAGEINEALTDFLKFEQISVFRIIPRLLTIEDDELTPTLKIKRKIVEIKFADVIEEMYRE